MSISRRGDVARVRVSALNEVGGGRWIQRWLAAAAAGEANISQERWAVRCSRCSFSKPKGSPDLTPPGGFKFDHP